MQLNKQFLFVSNSFQIVLRIFRNHLQRLKGGYFDLKAQQFAYVFELTFSDIFSPHESELIRKLSN